MKSAALPPPKWSFSLLYFSIRVSKWIGSRFFFLDDSSENFKNSSFLEDLVRSDSIEESKNSLLIKWSQCWDDLGVRMISVLEWHQCSGEELYCKHEIIFIGGSSVIVRRFLSTPCAVVLDCRFQLSWMLKSFWSWRKQANLLMRLLNSLQPEHLMRSSRSIHVINWSLQDFPLVPSYLWRHTVCDVILSTSTAAGGSFCFLYFEKYPLIRDGSCDAAIMKIPTHYNFYLRNTLSCSHILRRVLNSPCLILVWCSNTGARNLSSIW